MCHMEETESVVAPSNTEIQIYTFTLSNQTSERKTNMASLFSSSICFNLTDDFTLVAEGPPKKLMFPKYALKEEIICKLLSEVKRKKLQR